MRLNSEISDYFGAILTGVFAMAADGKESSANYAAMENKFLNIIADIKDKKSCDANFFRNHIFHNYAASFNMIANTYPIEEIIGIIRTEATFEELQYCKNTLNQFIRDLATGFNRPDLVNGFMLLTGSFE